MIERISNPDFLELMEEAFSRGSTVCFTPSGTSMLPMLNGTTDTVTLSKKPSQLHQYDVIFYVREGGVFVLHRIVKCEKDGTFTLSGDSQYYLEKGVRYEDVKALMTSYTHLGKERSVTSFSYQFYIRRMILKKRIRMFLSSVYHKVLSHNP
ncbi:MAG: S24/S26 family peptidase [Ruminococcus sp.]|nr:S24/S26 family peptidase [Ruminococcus sp.]